MPILDNLGFRIAGFLLIVMVIVNTINVHNFKRQCINCGKKSRPKKKRLRKEHKIIEYCKHCGQISSITPLLKKA